MFNFLWILCACINNEDIIAIIQLNSKDRMLAIAVSINIIECSVCDLCYKDKSVSSYLRGPFMVGSIVIVFIFVDKWVVAGSLIQGHLVCCGYVCMYVYVCVFVCGCVCNTSC